VSKITPENQLTNSIIQYLSLNGFRCYKIYNGAVPMVRKGKIVYRAKKKEYAGVPDLIAIKPNEKILFIEAKVKPRQPTEAQVEFLETVDGVPEVHGVVCYDPLKLVKYI